MAELEARYDDQRGAKRLLWTNILPDDREVSLGRNPLSQPDAPEENRAEWVVDPRDTFVSGCHAFLRWDGERLHVRIRTHPKKPTNPIFFQRADTPTFSMTGGQSFVIGNTTFTLLHGDGAGATDEDPADPLMLTQVKLNPADLRQISFNDTSHILKALSRFPTLVRYARDDAGRDDNLLKLIGESLRQADIVAIVRTDERSKEFRVAVQQVLDNRRRVAGSDFRPSSKLTRRALMDMENTLHVRGHKFDTRSADVTFDADVDWAICCPLVKDGPFRLGLYVAGHLPPTTRSGDGEVPAELRDYQKVVGLAAQIYESAHDLRKAQQHITRYQGFLSRNVVTLLNAANADELMKPRETDVTVLFCDLRGSCRLAEQGAVDLLGNWGRISQALDVMTTAITDEGGVIGDLQGDAAMGFWGWPIAQPDQVQVQKAARAAIRIQRDFARGKAGNSDYVCGIGLAFGKAVAGRLGTSDQIKLDVFGPVVNLAARLEGLTKHFGVPILAEQRVADSLAIADPQGFTFQLRQLVPVAPKGMTQSVPVFEVCPPGEYEGRQKDLWDAAVKAFLVGRFAAARDKLDEFALTGGRAEGNPAAQLLQSMMAPHGDRGPAEWDGVYRPDSK